MQIELNPEIEITLHAESSETGLSPEEIVTRVIADYARARTERIHVGRLVRTADLHKEEPVSAELLERRRLAVERIIAMQNAPDAPKLNLPEGVSIRQWMHEDHRYKD